MKKFAAADALLKSDVSVLPVPTARYAHPAINFPVNLGSAIPRTGLIIPP